MGCGGKSHKESEVTGVIVPVRNRAGLLEETLDSIFAQTLRPLHLVVVDNGSADNSMEVARRWAEAHASGDFRISVVEEQTEGASAARNRGLRATDASHIVFFDSDDIMYPSLLERAMREFREDENVDMVTWRHSRISPAGEKVGKSHVAGKYIIESHLVHAVVATHSFMARRELIERAGRWDENLPVWNDYEYGLRLLLSAKGRICSLRDVLYEVRLREDSITGSSFSDKAGLWERSLDRMDEVLASSGHPDSVRLHRILTYRRIILAAHYAREGHPGLSHNIKKAILSDGSVSWCERLLLRFTWIYTKFGGRGAWKIVKYGYLLRRRTERDAF